MRNFFFKLFIFFWVPWVSLFAANSLVFAFDWKEEKGDHFIVYHEADPSFAKEVLRRSESYYGHIASDLGYARYSNFWQWDNRVKIFIHASKSNYLKYSDQPEWSEGVANYTHKHILTYRQSENFLDALLPHEITHLIFRDFVGFEGQIPLWLDEGVAQWEEPQKRTLAKRIALFLLEKKEVIPLKDLATVNDLSDKTQQKIHYFYMESVSVVDFLMKTYGSRAFTDFCRQLRDGKSMDEALRLAYSGSIRDVDELQNKWIKSIKEG